MNKHIFANCIHTPLSALATPKKERNSNTQNLSKLEIERTDCSPSQTSLAENPIVAERKKNHAWLKLARPQVQVQVVTEFWFISNRAGNL